jgi:hypothetical protein
VNSIQRLRIGTHGGLGFGSAEYSVSHNLKLDAIGGKLGYLKDRAVMLGYKAYRFTDSS